MNLSSRMASPVSFQGRSISAVIVDLDGTMIDTLGDLEAALGSMLQELGGKALSRGTIAPMIGKGSEHLVDLALREAGIDHDRNDALLRYLGHYQRVNGRHAEVFPGVSSGLAGLQQCGVRLACLTNKPLALARSLLDSKGLLAYFPVVFGGDSFARKKPDPMPILETCKVLCADPAQVLMVGDSANDAQAARAAGCPVALVTYGYNHGQPVRDVDADAFFDTFEALAAALENLTRATTQFSR